jgi:hypothetical protein
LTTARAGINVEAHGIIGRSRETGNPSTPEGELMSHEEFDDFSNPYRAPISKMEDAPSPGFSSTTQGINLAVENPWLTIWTRPRATIRGIVDYDPTYRVVPIAAASGIVQTLDRMMQKNAGDMLSLAALIGLAAVVGSLAGLVQLVVAGWWFSNMGRIFGGRADSKQVRTVVAWAVVPSFATVPFLVLAVALLGKGMFTSELPEGTEALAAVVLIALGAVQVIFGIWSAVVFSWSFSRAWARCMGSRRGGPWPAPSSPSFCYY